MISLIVESPDSRKGCIGSCVVSETVSWASSGGLCIFRLSFASLSDRLVGSTDLLSVRPSLTVGFKAGVEALASLCAAFVGRPYCGVPYPNGVQSARL